MFHFVIDEWFLTITLLVSLGLNLIAYAFAYGFQTDHLTDATYSLSFIALAILVLCLCDTYYTRQIVVFVLLVVWALRMGIYLFVRICTIKKDDRFDGIRESWWKFGLFFFAQATMVWIVFWPVCFLLGEPDIPLEYHWRDALGYTLFVIGLLIETIADVQKFRFRNDPANSDHWCDTGLWSWSRHPNYYGEILLWWGLFTVCSTAFELRGEEWKYFSIIGTVLHTLSVLTVAGVQGLEKKADEHYWHRADYQEYKQRTSALLLLPPPLYARIPRVLKAIFLFEWPIYWHPQPDSAAGAPKRVNSKQRAEGERTPLTRSQEFARTGQQV